MQPDPPVRGDGLCVTCRKPRKVSGLKLLYRQAMGVDPFCSSECARKWWGTTLAKPSERV